MATGAATKGKPAAIAKAMPGLTTEMNTIVAAFTSSTSALKALNTTSATRAIAVRQATIPVGVLLGALVADVVAAVDSLLASLGLGMCFLSVPYHIRYINN